MTKDIRNLILAIASTVISLLMTINLFFIKRLVDKVDKIDKLQETTWQLRQDSAILALKVDEIQTQLRRKN